MRTVSQVRVRGTEQCVPVHRPFARCSQGAEQAFAGVTDVPREYASAVADSPDLGGQAAERDLLSGYLDWYRGVVENKVTGLSVEDARRVMTPAGLSPLGIVKHLGDVEQSWFRERFAGEEINTPWSDEDPLAVFRIEPGETVAGVVDFYRESTEHSRRIVSTTASLDDISVGVSPFYGHVSLRWILVHMLEETARHAGHLDLMREQIDGQTGD
jgi:hypothetical protein